MLRQAQHERASKYIHILLLLFNFQNITFATIKKNIFSLSQQEAHEIGQRLWHNECNKRIDGLTSWNNGEAFASLGIGHFIWFPRNCSAPFTETFPSLLMFLKKHTITLPTWLTKSTACPWQSREEFIAALHTQPMKELRTLLSTTIDLQVMFIVERMHNALSVLIKNTPLKKRRHIEKKLHHIAQKPHGLYVLIDYINFKGEGTNPKERYNGHGWGLLQVLTHMETTDKQDPCKAFAQAARTVLHIRVQHAPNKDVEERFLPGWLNRIKTYVQN